MTKVDIYTQDGGKKGSVDLPERLFGLPWSERLVHQATVAAANNRRAGTAHTKDRSEVRGGGRKPWRQKGTGRARHGSIRSPLWIGGGVTFGPRSEKNYTTALNKKMRIRAFFTVLSQKAREGAVAFIDSFSFEEPSTKRAVVCAEKMCSVVSVTGEAGGASVNKKKNMCTIVLSENDSAVRKSFANVKGVNIIPLNSFNVLDAFNARRIIFVGAEKTLADLEERGTKLSDGKSAGEESGEAGDSKDNVTKNTAKQVAKKTGAAVT